MIIFISLIVVVMKKNNKKRTPATIILLLARLIAWVILLQTLIFKFGLTPDALAESQAIFRAVSQYLLGTDSYEWLLRISGWVAELIIVILLIIPTTVYLAGIALVLLMISAIFLHITVLWYDQVFVMAILVLIAGLYIVAYHKRLGAHIFMK